MPKATDNKAPKADAIVDKLTGALPPSLRVKRLDPAAQMPKYQSAGAACFDLHALLEDGAEVVVTNRRPKVFRTGLAFEVPPGHVLMVYSRSGHGFKTDVRLSNSVGVIDSDYRGEVFVKLIGDTTEHLVVRNGDRVAQAMVVPVDQWVLEEVKALSETARGVNGCGSTGA